MRTPILGFILATLLSAQADELATRTSRMIEELRGGSAEASVLESAQSLGVELLRESRYKEAAQLFASMREVAPADARWHYGEALALFNLGRTSEAEILARSSVEKSLAPAGTSVASHTSGPVFGSRADAFVLLGVVLAVKGDYAEALAALNRAVEIEPENFDAQLSLGRAYFGAGDPKSAARAFRQAVKLRSNDARARFYLASSLESAGDEQAALAAYRELIAIAPNGAEGHLGLGAMLVKRGGADLAAGITELRNALAINDGLYEGQVELGRALLRSGSARESIKHFERAAELAPQNPEPHFQMAIAHRRLGDKQAAAREDAIVKEIHRARRGAPDTTVPAKP
jgi:cytochrome c-type biogenesis protein CcmH/NrfG